MHLSYLVTLMTYNVKNVMCLEYDKGSHEAEEAHNSKSIGNKES
jgi:hypothetical protein